MNMKEYLFSKRQVYEIIVPLIMEQVFMAAIGMFDVMMVSGLGEQAISAVSLVDFINQLITSVLTALSTGGAIVCSQYLGRKNRKSAGEAAEQLIMLVLAAGVLFWIIAGMGNYAILNVIYGTLEKEIIENAAIYFGLSAISYPFIALFCCSAAIIRALGYTKTSFRISLLMNIMNIVLNAFFIFQLRWGVFGAGLASLLSRFFVSVILFVLLICRQDTLRFRALKKWRLKRKAAGTILQFAIPTSLESSVFYIGRLLVQGVVTGFGTSAIAANAVALTVTEFLHMPGAGIGIGMITVVGRCIGAKEKEQARWYSVYLLRLTYLIQGICCLICMAVTEHIIDWYHLGEEANRLAVFMLMTHGVICIVFWPMAFTGANVLKAAGDVRFTMIISIATMWLFRVGGSYLFVNLFPAIGVIGVWCAMYCDWIARAVIYYLRFRGNIWMEKQVK